MQLLNQHNAYRYVLEFLKKQAYKWHSINNINKGRYVIVHGNPNIVIMFKKEFFMSFSKFFPEEKGVGETINTEDLKECIRNNVKTIYTVHPDGKIYSCPIETWIAQAHKRTTDAEGKSVYSINVNNLKRIKFQSYCQVFSNPL